jgi:glycolate oxidase FAD binding subunit
VGSGSTLEGRKVASVDVVMSTVQLSGIVDHQPDDLTVVVRAGTLLEDLDRTLSTHGQTAVLPEGSGHRTVGGVVASGASGYRRLRYGPTRDRVLGITLVTGYGEIVNGGGRLVKNVTGYDLARLTVGSCGSLGVIAEVCLKLWPQPPVLRTVRIDDPLAAVHSVDRASAVLETDEGVFAYLEGSEASVAVGEEALGGATVDGHAWPDPIEQAVVVSVRVPPKAMGRALDRVRSARPDHFIAQHGVGRIDAGWSVAGVDLVDGLRGAVHPLGGLVVVDRWAGGEVPDRWGMVPRDAGIAERLTRLFDPHGVLAADQLPGGA